VTTRLRVVLVDDERLARAELRRLLQAHPDIDIVGEAVDAADGLRQITELEPDLVFLDVQMPGGSGFDLLAALDAAPDVIFTTAFDRYALQAFEVNALDYLQKPVQAARLAAALDRCAQRRGREPERRPPARRPQTDRKLFVRDGERCWFVALRDVRILSAEGTHARAFRRASAAGAAVPEAVRRSARPTMLFSREPQPHRQPGARAARDAERGGRLRPAAGRRRHGGRGAPPRGRVQAAGQPVSHPVVIRHVYDW